eukprot:2959310-Prymnesium_polylepis.1
MSREAPRRDSRPSIFRTHEAPCGLRPAVVFADAQSPSSAQLARPSTRSRARRAAAYHSSRGRRSVALHAAGR